MKWYFLRHGQSEFNAGITTGFNSEMTPKGMEQAKRAALILKDALGEDVKAYDGWVSPYIRCLQTAVTVQALTGLGFMVAKELGESPEPIHRRRHPYIFRADGLFPTIDWGDLPRYPRQINYDEDAAEYNNRIRSFVELLKHRGRDAVIVSHMTPIIDMLRLICFEGRDEPLTIMNCSVSLVEDGKPIYIGNT